MSTDSRDLAHLAGRALSGVVRAFDSATWKADVQVTGSFATFLQGVPVNRGLAAAAITPGRWCVVIFNDASNPRDAVLVAVYE